MTIITFNFKFLKKRFSMYHILQCSFVMGVSMCYICVHMYLCIVKINEMRYYFIAQVTKLHFYTWIAFQQDPIHCSWSSYLHPVSHQSGLYLLRSRDHSPAGLGGLHPRLVGRQGAFCQEIHDFDQVYEPLNQLN